MKFLRKASDMLPVGDLRWLLHTHLNIKDEHRGVDHVHASELTKPEGLCPRFFALAIHTDAKLPGRWVSTSDSVTFWLGHALQDAVVNWFADMERAVGHWSCIACRRHHDFQKRPARCLKCGSKAFKPVEVRFVSAVSGAGGGIDMLVDVGKPLLRVVEIKTMSGDQFKGLVAPLAEHRLRTNLYLRLIAESGHPWAKRVDTKRADVLYVSKSGYGTAVDDQFKTLKLSEQFSPFKCYAISRSDSDTDALVARAAAVAGFKDGTLGMPDGVCATAFTQRAKQCVCAKQCFSGKYPVENFWNKEA